MISPDRQLALREADISGGCTKEKHILLRRADTVADGFRKEFPQPRSAGEDILIGVELRTIRKEQAIPFSAIKLTRRHGCLSVFTAFREKTIQHCLARHARREKTTLGFVDRPRNTFQIDLRPTFCEFPCGKLFVWNASLANRGAASTRQSIRRTRQPQSRLHEFLVAF